VAGNTFSTDFPTTAGTMQATHVEGRDLIVTKLDASGSKLVFSTYLGGSDSDFCGNQIVLDGAGSAYVTGATASVNFPTTTGAIQASSAGGFDAFVEVVLPTARIRLRMKCADAIRMSRLQSATQGTREQQRA
jgi:hypothetical protein